MVTAEESIPAKSDAFLNGIDIFYTQFNEVNFYIEDEEQENFYFEIFRKIFPQIRIEKIFPLRGKDNVVKESVRCIGDKDKIFIVDKDFDDLLGKLRVQPNLFYLRKYSIENYLLDESTILEYVVEERPRLKLEDIRNSFDFSNCIQSAGSLFYELTLLHFLVQLKGLNLKNTSSPPEKYFQFNSSISIRSVELARYKDEIQTELKKLDARLKVDTQVAKIKSKYRVKSVNDLIVHIPGKYLVKYVKCVIEHLFGLACRNIDSFNYRMARNNKFHHLEYLVAEVNTYRKSR
jgi:hypothetical protein